MDRLDVDQVLRELQLDENFSDFLSDDVDVKQKANQAIQSGVQISAQLAKLSEGILRLNKELHSQVVAHHGNLLSQANGIETLEGVLQMIQGRLQSLLAAVERIRSKVTEPYVKIATRVAQLQRLQEACDLLRRIIRIVYLCKRLRGQLHGGVREITKAAQTLDELSYLCEGVDLTGIEVLEQDRKLMKQARRDIENSAQSLLKEALESKSQTQIATPLQVFYNLSLLSPTVRGVVASCEKAVADAIDRSLDQRLLTASSIGGAPNSGRSGAMPGRAAMPTPGNTAAFRAALWTSLEKLTDALCTYCLQVQNLQRVLEKKRDPISQVCFITELAKDGGDVDLTKCFWIKTTQMLCEKLTAAAAGSTFLSQALEGEYPKLLHLCNDLWSRLEQSTSAAAANRIDGSILTGVPGSEPCSDNAAVALPSELEPFDSRKALRTAVASFETSYLARSLSRLFDPINLVFPQGSLSVPTSEEIDGIVRTISSELQVASFDETLSLAVAKNVAKTVQLYAVKCEQLLSTDGEASQVIGPPTQGQIRNASVVNSLYQLHHAVMKLIDSLHGQYHKESLAIIRSSLDALVVLMSVAVQPLFSSVGDALEAILLTMHQEDFSSAAPPSSSSSVPAADGQCSLYMRELQGFLQRVQSDYLSLFHCTDFILDSIQGVVCRAIELFVRHVSLVRPVGEGGKMRMAADCAQMELAVTPLCRRVSDLGRSYKLLRAFRPLLFLTAEHVTTSHSVGDVIPYTTALHCLYGKSPAEMKSPYQISNWSLSRYSQWLDDHTSEKDRLLLIKGALEAYVKTVRSRQGKEFAVTYPIMLELLQKGLQQATEG